MSYRLVYAAEWSNNELQRYTYTLTILLFAVIICCVVDLKYIDIPKNLNESRSKHTTGYVVPAKVAYFHR